MCASVIICISKDLIHSFSNKHFFKNSHTDTMYKFQEYTYNMIMPLAAMIDRTYQFSTPVIASTYD